MLLLALPALAAPFFTSVGPGVPIEVDRSGNWARAVPTESGWSFFFASGGDYWHAPLDDALVADLGATRPLTGRSDLVDHAITRCPDGTFLHAASYTVNQPDDSVVAFRYDAGFAPLETDTVVEGDPEAITRDMPVVCGETFTGLGVFDMAQGTTFAGDSALVVLEDAPMMTGSGWLEDGEALYAVGHGISDWGHVRLRGYDTDFALTASVDLPLVEAPLTAYWSQALVRIGDVTVLAFMARDEEEGWQLQDGNVWLAVLDRDWNVLETRQVTSYAAPIGAMQPGLAVKGDRLLVTYTHDVQPYALEVGFQLPESGSAVDPAADPVETVAGCAQAGAAALFFPLLGFRRRRQPAASAASTNDKHSASIAARSGSRGRGEVA